MSARKTTKTNVKTVSPKVVLTMLVKHIRDIAGNTELPEKSVEALCKVSDRVATIAEKVVALAAKEAKAAEREAGKAERENKKALQAAKRKANLKIQLKKIQDKLVALES